MSAKHAADMSKQKNKSEANMGASLSPEADRYLGEATAEFNAKQDALSRDWRFDVFEEWTYDQYGRTLKLGFKDGSQLEADGQILGSYMAARQSWEWAWNNPNVEEAAKVDSLLVKQVGQRLGIDYLLSGIVPAPAEEFVSYLCAIGIKATDSVGVFRGKAGPVDVMITLKNLRWVQTAKPR
jgi:Family of unknown function (DUF6882)